MRSLVGVDALAPQANGAAITVGTFDGVHVGHRALIARTLDEASELGATSVLITWDRHPLATLRPEAMPPLLTTPERKAELIAATGIDVLVVLPFTKEFSTWPPERFITDVLVALGAKSVMVGDGWRFGRKAAGDVELLAKTGVEHGFSVEGIFLAEVEGDPVSSTRVREAVGAGEMEEAHGLLARPFDVDGIVLRGDRRGTELGYPTANLAVDEDFVHPPRGIYAGRAHTHSSVRHVAAINVGVNPTFGGDPKRTPWRVEAY
ncbi:MAG: bifunctional riboflavin kinase/FMN adenylyltransferase, partial [Actinomycetota bacterium]